MRRFHLLLLGVVAAGLSWVVQVNAVERPGRAAQGQPPEVALHYDLWLVEGSQVSDASGKRHDGTMHHGEIVYGRNKNAVRLSGDGWLAMSRVPETLSPKSRPFTVGAYCQPAAGHGVLVAMGDKINGFSLYLKDGVPHFAVRSGGKLAKVVAEEPVIMNQWVHLAGSVDPAGTLRLIVNTWPVAEAPGKLLSQKSTEPFCVGADLGSPVGDHSDSMHWRGLIQDVRLYWGLLDRNQDRDQWGDWADRPGCGCSR